MLPVFLIITFLYCVLSLEHTCKSSKNLTCWLGLCIVVTCHSLTLGVHAQRGLQYFVCLCVCLCVYAYSGTIIGERKRANLVVRTARFIYIYIYATVRRPTAHAPEVRASFYPKGISKFSYAARKRNTTGSSTSESRIAAQSSDERDFSTLPLVPYSCKTNQIAGLCLIRAVV